MRSLRLARVAAAGLVAAVLLTSPGAGRASPLLYFVHTDHLNTPRLIADGNQTTVWRWDQVEPFGANAPDEDPDGNSVIFHMPFRFPGQYFDKETNLHYNYHREFDPWIGRYIQPDPIGAITAAMPTATSTLNQMYSYVNDNPLAYTDSKGLFIDTIWDVGNVIYDIWQGNWQDAAVDAAAMCVPGVPAGITKLRKLGPVRDAVGPHTVWKTDARGNIIRHETWAPNPRNPTGWERVQSTDIVGRPHYSKETRQYVPTPHTQGPNIPGGVRPALPSEIPRPR